MICDLPVGLESKNLPIDIFLRIKDCKILNDEQLVIRTSSITTEHKNTYLVVWNIKNKHCDSVIECQTFIDNFEVLPDRKIVIVGRDSANSNTNTIRVWDIIDGNYIEHKYDCIELGSFIYRSFDDTLINYSREGIVKIFDQNNLNQIGEFVNHNNSHCNHAIYSDGMIFCDVKDKIIA